MVTWDRGRCHAERDPAQGVIAMSSTSPQPSSLPAAVSRESLEEQARSKGVRPITSVHELARDGIWESDEELDAFLEHVRASRQAETT